MTDYTHTESLCEYKHEHIIVCNRSFYEASEKASELN